jgi:integrase
MINRENYILMRDYLAYLERVQQLDKTTVSMHWQGLKHLIQWAGSRHFKDAPKIIPSFPEYLLTARNERHPNDKDNGKPLSPRYMKKIFGQIRAFFKWIRTNQHGFQTITEAWTETLKVRRSADTQSRLKERSYWKLEDVQKIAALKPSCLRERRDIAALCFLYLSAMRIGAFVTLPLDCVDVDRRRVMQLPEKGVQTKNTKAAVTFLLPIPDLLAVVKDWDAYMRTLAGVPYNWYPALQHPEQGNAPKPGLLSGSYTGRAEAFDKGMAQLCQLAGVPYKSPHKIRHGFGVYGVKNAKDMGQMKAISQNMMHAHMGITDGLYGKLAEDDLADILSEFGN